MWARPQSSRGLWPHRPAEAPAHRSEVLLAVNADDGFEALGRRDIVGCRSTFRWPARYRRHHVGEPAADVQPLGLRWAAFEDDADTGSLGSRSR